MLELRITRYNRRYPIRLKAPKEETHQSLILQKLIGLLVAEMLNQDKVGKICERYFMKKSLSLWYPTYGSPYKVKNGFNYSLLRLLLWRSFLSGLVKSASSLLWYKIQFWVSSQTRCLHNTIRYYKPASVDANLFVASICALTWELLSTFRDIDLQEQETKSDITMFQWLSDVSCHVCFSVTYTLLPNPMLKKRACVFNSSIPFTFTFLCNFL